ncbi:hypothetical protein P9D51_10070 [Bacillus sonorensis]|nr:hypothetical protein [Bacillus sonorensis]MEC1426470.1 hypothetical protein [Bacillus sonorensis]
MKRPDIDEIFVQKGNPDKLKQFPIDACDKLHADSSFTSAYVKRRWRVRDFPMQKEGAVKHLQL